MVRLTSGAVVSNVATPPPRLLSPRTNSSALAALALATQNALRRRASTGNMPSDEKKRRQRQRQNSSIDLGNGDDNDDDSLPSISSTDSESEDLIIEGDGRQQEQEDEHDFQKMERILSSLSKALSLSPFSSSTPPPQGETSLPQRHQQQQQTNSTTMVPPPLVVEEEIFTTRDMTLLGRIEIQLVQDPARQCEFIPRIRITCFPNSSSTSRQLTTAGSGGVRGGGSGGGDMLSSNNNDDDENDFYDADATAAELPQSMMDQFASTFMETCAMDTSSGPHSDRFTPKSSLRSKQRSPLHEYQDDFGLEKKHSVSFDKVDIHEFLMTLGDHPSAASGPPVAIDWEHKAQVHILNLDEYERSRPARRSRKDLKLSLRDRKGILLGAGRFSNQEVHLAWQEARNIRKQRRETIRRGVFLMVYDDMMESANRKMSRFADSMSLCSCFAC